MISALLIIGGAYSASLVYCAVKGRREFAGDERQFMSAGGGIGSTLGFLTFSATLFSTFTLMGIPDFFRVHGVGAWIFLGVTDVAMAFVALWFGMHLRKRIKATEFTSVKDILNESYGGRFAGIVYLIGIFIFLLPYVAIQIRGIAIFLHAVVPGEFDIWIWSIGIVVFMLVYSTIGGLRAIMYSDAIQGVVLLVVTWTIATVCISNIGGLEALFAEVSSSNSALLSTPGPKGLFSVQFLVASFLAIVIMPISQPQLTIRLTILRTDKDFRKMVIAVGLFSILVILPTIVIGLYGAVKYSSASTAEFLSGVLVTEQSTVIAAFAIVGLIAAAMSTADSQLFALGSEFKNTFLSKLAKPITEVKVVIFIFAFLAFLLALVSNDQLVMLARVSFGGTALIAPMVLAAIIKKCGLRIEIPVLSLACLLLFLLAQIRVLPSTFVGIRIDLFLLIFVSLAVLSSYLYGEASER